MLSLQKWLPNISWKDIERTLLIIGVLGAFVALSTGDVAEHLTRPNRNLVETHSLFATTATWMYVLLLIGELLTIYMSWLSSKIASPIVLRVLTFIRDLFTHPILSKTMAALGLVTISITGLLGGVMVYGTSADPLAGFILQILGIQY